MNYITLQRLLSQKSHTHTLPECLSEWEITSANIVSGKMLFQLQNRITKEKFPELLPEDLLEQMCLKHIDDMIIGFKGLHELATMENIAKGRSSRICQLLKNHNVIKALEISDYLPKTRYNSNNPTKDYNFLYAYAENDTPTESDIKRINGMFSPTGQTVKNIQKGWGIDQADAIKKRLFEQGQRVNDSSLT